MGRILGGETPCGKACRNRGARVTENIFLHSTIKLTENGVTVQIHKRSRWHKGE
jgi:hypothetical protein